MRHLSRSLSISRNCLKYTSSEIVQSTDTFVFDCDGVLWLGNNVIPGALESISKLKQLGKRVFFFTNNSTKSRALYVERFKKLGFNDVHSEDIHAASSAAALYISQLNLSTRNKCAYAIGSTGLYDELDMAQVPYIKSSIHDSLKVAESMTEIVVDSRVEVVVVGFDLSINYYKIQYAQLCLNTLPNCKLVGTNLDATAYYTPTQLWAENGAMVGAIQGCTAVEPIITGKPSGFIIDHIVDKYKLDRSRMCIVGDRLDTDIMLGKKNGLKSVLTLSGVTSSDTLYSAKNTIIPDCVIDSIANLA
jgi:phosphoglycolate/pyridoxal phosphate phosphatase family enzyme